MDTSAIDSLIGEQDAKIERLQAEISSRRREIEDAHVARNAFIAARLAIERQPQGDTLIATGLVGSVPTPHKQVKHRKISPKWKNVLQLIAIEDASIAKISEIVGASDRLVRNQLHYYVKTGLLNKSKDGKSYTLTEAGSLACGF